MAATGSTTDHAKHCSATVNVAAVLSHPGVECLARVVLDVQGGCDGGHNLRPTPSPRHLRTLLSIIRRKRLGETVSLSGGVIRW